MFFGRQDLLDEMSLLWTKRVSSLVTCRGRRRIGKSTLIKHFAELSHARFIKIEGLKPRKEYGNIDELRIFASQLAAQTGCERTPPEDWLSAFIRLGREIRPTEKTVVLLDEISWLGYYDPTFADTIKIAWDNYWKANDRLILVLCGSVSSWIAENILNGTGFAGRDSLDFVIDELPLQVCRAFWGTAAERVSTGEILDVLSVTGGVPKYLEEINPGVSSDENIRQLCFTREGILFRDFNQIFSQIFGKKSQMRKALLKAIAYGAKSATEIAETLGIERNGHLVEHLSELELAGFVAKDGGVNPCTGRVGRIVRYRLKDNYARFYLHHIEPHAKEVEAGLFQCGSLAELKGWDVMKGLQFENLVISNYRALLPILGIDGASLLSAAPYRRAKSTDLGGVQVDLLLQTRTTAYLVEIKRRESIGLDVVSEINDKAHAVGFRSDMSVRTVLVYDGRLASSIRTDHLLDFAIPVERLFE